MSDWEKLERIARLQKKLAELQEEIIERQTHTRYVGGINMTANDVQAAWAEVNNEVLLPLLRH
jgi:hypothetical protein